MNNIIFVLGGCKSGKSRYALDMAESLAPARKVFIATCVPLDDEMKIRVANHQKERDFTWKTVEAPVKLPEILFQESKMASVVLVDCLALWTNNLLMEKDNKDIDIQSRIKELVESLNKALCPIILVSNEVGAGIVPDNAMARRYRDVLGLLNQRIAKCAQKVVWVMAGIPLVLKPKIKKISNIEERQDT